jgi:tight adherence protein C
VLTSILIAMAATILMSVRAAQAWRALPTPLSARLASLGARVRPHDRGELDGMRAELVAAGIRDPAAVDLYLAARVVSLLGGVALGALVGARAEPLVGVLCGCACVGLGALLPARWLAWRAAARRRAVAGAFAAAVDLLATCMDAGLGLEQSLERVGDELGAAEPVLADELGALGGELDAGIPIGDAMRRLGRRVRLDELSMFCAVVAHASELGARLGPTLRDYASSMRRRRIAALDEHAGRMGALLTLPLTLCLLPAALLVMMAPTIVTMVSLFGGHR